MFLRKSLPWIVVIIIALVPRLWSFGLEGHLWDEHFYYDAAHSTSRALSELNFDPNAWRENFEHPPVGKYLLWPGVLYNQIFNRQSSELAYDAPRVVVMVESLITILLTGYFATRLFSKRTGIIAAVILALSPVFIAYSRIINLDMSLTLFTTGSIGFFILAGDKNQPKSYLAAAGFAGLALATKYSGALLLPLFAIILIIQQWPGLKQNKGFVIPWQLFILPPIMLATLIVFWPFLWQNTFGHLVESFFHWGGDIDELFLGREQTGPIYYFALYFLATTPALLFIPVLTTLWSKIKNQAVIWAWFLVPFLISLYHLRQGGPRYILLALPAFAILVALGVDKLSRHFKVVPIVITAYLLITLVAIQPYYIDYYNELVGFTKTVQSRRMFEVGFYGEGVREAINYINQNAKSGEQVHFEIQLDDAPWLRKDLIRNDVAGTPWLVTNVIAERNKPDKIDTSQYRQVYQVRALGAVLARVYYRQ